MEKVQLSSMQKMLLYSLYGFIFLMIFFSLLAIKDRNFAGYEKCVQAKCEKKSQAFCSKPRELMNCCVGAGGQLASLNNQYTCVFS